MHVLLTGASSGIGESLARAFGQRGDDVTLVARRREMLADLAGKMRGKVHVAAADLTDLAGIDALVEGAVAALGPVDALVNNAGFQVVKRPESVTAAELERTLEVNLVAPLRLVQAVLPAMKARGRGTIVNVASVAAYAHARGQTHYSASKAGLAAFSRSLGSEVRRDGIHVLTVLPGPVRTPMGTGAASAYEKDPSGPLPWGEPDELARRILAAMDARRSLLVYPRFYRLAVWFPGITRMLVDRAAPVPRE